MPEYDERAELAPRDVVAKSIVEQMEKTRHPNVYLDLSRLEVEQISVVETLPMRPIDIDPSGGGGRLGGFAGGEDKVVQ